ncbi:MAG TPA: hypothetical protein VMF06_20530 [Candidatus Limnocylindria bacterium]|nr:hypothetical protein [Candidatus Limnocylindria bacterium]
MEALTRDHLNPAFWAALGTAEFPELGPGPRRERLPIAEIRGRLKPFAGTHAGECNQSSLLEAVTLLYHDHHDEAHDLVQDLACPEGVLIHAILHRREPDYWNAKYWFRRITDHPVYRLVTVRVDTLPTSAVSQRWLPRLSLADTFDPMGMVDACEEVAGQNASSVDVLFLRKVQHLEFESLVEHLLAGGA